MVYFITAIDTGVGKTIATGLLARTLASQGKKVITAKLVQTGCNGIAEDIVCHRELMGIDLLAEDISGDTCGYVFELPASPHLAAEKAGRQIDIDHIKAMVSRLEADYDTVLLEGAGGLMVPLTREMLSVDLAVANDWPIIIVTGPRLGSINHTLLTIDAALNRSCKIAGIIYNLHCDDQAVNEIVNDTSDILTKYLAEHSCQSWFVTMPKLLDKSDSFIFQHDQII